MAKEVSEAATGTFDEYRIIRPLGHGAMGHVYLAHDTILDRPVAIKFIAAANGGPTVRARMLVEARAIARLHHPNVVAVFRVGEAGDQPYLVSEFVRGKTLRELKKPLPSVELHRVASGLARGLAAAHRSGVLHRDLKPANAMLAEDGEVKLLDFGLAKLLGGEEAQAAAGSVGPSAREEVVAEAGFVKAAAALREARIQPPTAKPERMLGAPGPYDDTHTPELTLTTSDSDLDTASEETLPHSSLAPADGERAEPLTLAGALLGTPFYMAPEILLGEVATARSDVYSLGVMLYELACGEPPHRAKDLVSLCALKQQAARPLRELAPGVEAQMAAVIHRCLHREPGKRFRSAAELCDALEAIGPSSGKTTLPLGNPYRGLESFEAEHRALFFGRKREVRVILDRLRAEPTVFITGDSGSGKSSLVRAGIVPAIQEGALRDDRSWKCLRIVPGTRPHRTLAASLAVVLDGDEDAIFTQAAQDPARLARMIRRELGGQLGLVLLVDQLEELVTLSDPDEARTFANVLGELSSPSPNLRSIATVRGDFLTRLASLRGLAEALSRSLYVLGPLGPEGTREAIVGPARVKGVQFESEAMVDGLVHHHVGSNGSLPLLQFALAELWEARDQAESVIEARALELLGGVAGALSRHADQVIAQLSEIQRVAARRILLALLTSEGTRRRRSQSELGLTGNTEHTTLDALLRSRLIVARESEEGTSYELAHEALVQGWQMLRHWLEDDAGERALRERLERSASEWERLGQSDDQLWGARQLGELARLTAPPIAKQAAFIAASRRAAVRRRWLRIGAIGALPVLAALIYGVVSWRAAWAVGARIEEHLRSAAVVIASHDRDAALLRGTRDRSLTGLHGGDAEEAEALWTEATDLARAMDVRLATLSKELEGVRMLDRTQRRIPTLLARVVYERLLLARFTHQREHAAELLERISLFDLDAVYRKRLEAPVALAIVGRPPHARVTIQQYGAPPGRVLGPPRAVPSDTQELSLAAGSYVLRVTTDTSEVRSPFLVEAGESLRIDAAVPGTVPEGYVYVPPGRFLYGSADPPMVRKFLEAQPQHAVTTRGFLIGRTAVTFGEWLSYLDRLPPDQRARRTPHAEAFRGGVSLRRAAGRWQIALRPAGVWLVADEQSPIVYPGRRRRARQDWRRFPVGGINLDDARAYSAWLDATGRLPGARLCTEHEWERAARGADDRLFPHGDALRPGDANFDATYDRDPSSLGPDEVGAYPVSRSPFGVDDMAGNTFAWTLDPAHPERGVPRGGAYYFESFTARSANRTTVESTMRELMMGARVCATR